MSYRDGTVEQYWLGTERVRLQHSPGEQLPPPDAERLAHLAQKYQEQAQLLDDERQQKQLVHASASGTCDTVAADEVTACKGLQKQLWAIASRRCLD